MDEKEIFNILIQKAYHYLSLRDRSEKEMRDYLTKKIERYKKTDKVVFLEKLIHQLKEDGYINDAKFVSWWVEQRNYFRPKGKFILTQELLQKGVDKKNIDAYFEEILFDEVKLAKDALIKKKSQLQLLTGRQKEKKAIDQLLRRGFSYSAAKKAFEDLLHME